MWCVYVCSIALILSCLVLRFVCQCRVLKSAQYPVLLVLEVSNATVATNSNTDTVTSSSSRSSSWSPFKKEMKKENKEPREQKDKSQKSISTTIATTKKQKTFLFKMEDDLRQDKLVLQIFQFMDQAFLRSGLDLNLMHYDVLPTGPREGKRMCE